MSRAEVFKRVLGEHRPKPDRAYQCRCGHWATNHKNPDMAAEHRAHVAAALAAALAQEGDQGDLRAAVRALADELAKDGQATKHDGPAERARRAAHQADERRLRATLAPQAGREGSG